MNVPALTSPIYCIWCHHSFKPTARMPRIYRASDGMSVDCRGEYLVLFGTTRFSESGSEYTVVFQSIRTGVWPVTAASKSDHSDRPFVIHDSQKFFRHHALSAGHRAKEEIFFGLLWPCLKPIQTAPLWPVTSEIFWKFWGTVTCDIQIDWNATVSTII